MNEIAIWLVLLHLIIIHLGLMNLELTNANVLSHHNLSEIGIQLWLSFFLNFCFDNRSSEGGL